VNEGERERERERRTKKKVKEREMSLFLFPLLTMTFFPAFLRWMPKCLIKENYTEYELRERERERRIVENVVGGVERLSFPLRQFSYLLCYVSSDDICCDEWLTIGEEEEG
jgi:hypothetical protein